MANTVVILKIPGGYKQLEKPNKKQSDAEKWIVKMMESAGFVIGWTTNGKFAAVTDLCAEYLRSIE